MSDRLLATTARVHPGLDRELAGRLYERVELGARLHGRLRLAAAGQENDAPAAVVLIVAGERQIGRRIDAARVIRDVEPAPSENMYLAMVSAS